MRHASHRFLRAAAAALLLAGGLRAAWAEPAAQQQPEMEPAHGLALYGPQDLKYRDWAAHGGHFDCVNPDAPKGGNLTLGTMAGATKLNRFSLRGVPVNYAYGLAVETLMTNSPDPDEPFSMYGLIAEKAAIAPDRLAVTYWLNPKARFSDGVPVTADDVVFTFNLFQDPGVDPFYRNYYSEVERIEKVDAMTVRFHLKSATNQELPLITSQMPVLPKHVYGVPGKNFGEDFQNVLVGSGPYRVKSFTPDFNTELVLERDPDWWGKDLPVNRGCYNFDTITLRFFQDPDKYKDALKSMTPSSRIDVMEVVKSEEWVKEFDDTLVRNRWLVRRSFPHQRLSDMPCLAFNLRRPLFQDIRIRRAIASALDFEGMNRQLFYRAFTRQVSCWDNNPRMMSRGPAEGHIRDWLLELNKKYGDALVPPDAWRRGPYNMDTGADGRPMPLADRIAATSFYLQSIGWKYDKDADVRVKDGQELAFEMLVPGTAYLQPMTPFVENLRKTGIRCSIRVVQAAEYMKRFQEFDFDMIPYYLYPSDSPGNEMLDYFHSSSANIPGSSNISGFQNPAMDEVIRKILACRNRADLVDAVKTLDRIICANHYVIPRWYIPADRLAFWNRFGYPANLSTRISPPDYTVMMYWWVDAEKDAALRKAMADGRKLSSPTAAAPRVDKARP